MENAYGIGITNRFAQFLQSDDDEDTIKTSEHEKDTKKKGKIAEKENRAGGKEGASGEVTTTHPPRAQPTAPVINQQPGGGAGARKGIRDSNQKNNANDSNAHRVNNRGGDSERGYRSGPPRDNRDRFSKPDEHREDRNNRRNKDEGGRDFVQREGDGGDRGARRGGFGGFRGGRGGPRGGLRKREFDRQSGSDKSGVKPVDKRDGAGSRNWGTYKDDIEDTTVAQAGGEEANEEKAEQTGQNANEEGTTNDVAAAPEEEPAKQMTLDEYRALQNSQTKTKPVFNVRKAGEGEDTSQWNKMTLKKKEEKLAEENEQEEEDDDQKHGGRQKKLLDIEFQFSDSRRGINNGPGGGRGGRGGGGRGGTDRGRGFNKGFRPRFENRDARPARQPTPKVDDERDFPSLGKR